jgi:HemY protein
MRRYLFFLIVLIFSVWLGIKISQDPGYLFLSYGNWSVEMPLWFAVVATLITLFILYSILRFFDSIDFSLYQFKNWLRWKRKSKSYSKTNRGLVELVESHWRGAEHYLLDGVPQSEAPLINYLGAAKAAHEQGAYERRDHYLKKAHDVAPHADIAIGLTQARLLMKQGQLEQALAILKRLQQISPRHVSVLKMLQKINMRLGDWQALLQLIPQLRRAKVLSRESAERLEQATYQEILISADKDSKTIREIFEAMPRRMQKNSDVIFTYAKLLSRDSGVDSGAANKSAHLIEQILKKEWHEDSVKLYGLLVTNNPTQQLTHAENWLKHYGEQSILFLTLGRICLRCQLWGKARQYFEASLNLAPAPETYSEFGKLLEQLGEVNYAFRNYREALEKLS